MSAPAWCGAIIVAAGGSTRMGGLDKQFALLAERPVLAHSVAIFEAAPEVHAIVVVAGPLTLARVQALGAVEGWRKVVAVVPGGARRQDSADHGLAALRAAAAAAGAVLDLVLVHDGARPLTPPAVITGVIAAARQHGAAIAAIPARDTIKVAAADGRIGATPDRATLWQAQTPQAFRADLLVAAYQAAHARNLAVTDDAALLEALGIPVYLAPGDARNLKITLPDDLLIATALLSSPDL